MLAISQPQLVFHTEGLALAGLVAAAAGAVAFWAIVAHWVLKARAWALAPLLVAPPLAALVAWLRGARAAGGEALQPAAEAADAAEPILPWWQVLVGFALAGVLLPLAHRAAVQPEPKVELALMVVLAATAVAWVLFFYLRVYRYLGRLPMAALYAMRVLAVLLLVLLIFKPTLSYDAQVSQRSDLYVLLDASRSMSVRDWPDTPHRLATAIQQVQDYLDRLRTAFEVKLYRFDTRARPIEVGAWPEPEGEATNLARALKDVAVLIRPADKAGLVLMSDGLHNAGGAVLEDLAALHLPPVYAVGIGTDLTAQSGYQDISIEDVRAPEESVVNNIARLTVDVEAVGLADRSVEVQMREGETLVASAPLRLDAAQGTQSVALTVTPTRVGRHTYTVSIPPDPAERRSENNAREVHLLVTDPKIRVLYIEGVVRPEYKPLKSVLETDPNVELAALVQIQKGQFLQSGSLKGLTLTGFPQTLDDMRRFDVFLLGDVDRTYFSSKQMENLKIAIAEGRGLAMLGGYNSFGPGGYEGTPMEEILPVAVGPRTIGQETTPFVLKLTPEGANHPIFHGTTDFFLQQGGSGGAPEERLPYLKGCNVLGRPRPGASVLAVHPERTGEHGPLVVLAVQPYGQGRSAAFAADTTYQWYLPLKALGRESPYVKFWGQMVRWLANKEIKEASDQPGVTLLVRKPYYNPGERIPVRAKVRAEEGRATNFAEVTGVLLMPADERRTFDLALAPGSVGVYETQLEPLDPGAYRIVVEARKDRQRLGLEEVEFTVGRPNQEFERLSIDRSLLQEIARATGGQYYEPAAFGDLVESLRSRTIKEDIHREIGIHTVPGLFTILFLVFLALVTGEWLIRKYYQLN